MLLTGFVLSIPLLSMSLGPLQTGNMCTRLVKIIAKSFVYFVSRDRHLPNAMP